MARMVSQIARLVNEAADVGEKPRATISGGAWLKNRMQARFMNPQTTPATMTGTSTATESLAAGAIGRASSCLDDFGTRAKAASAAIAQSALQIITDGHPSTCAV